MFLSSLAPKISTIFAISNFGKILGADILDFSLSSLLVEVDYLFLVSDYILMISLRSFARFQKASGGLDPSLMSRLSTFTVTVSPLFHNQARLSLLVLDNG